jgi:D-alanyl-D-alanine endopeptidase (penicillin-binding protein 7)
MLRSRTRWTVRFFALLMSCAFVAHAVPTAEAAAKKSKSTRSSVSAQRGTTAKSVRTAKARRYSYSRASSRRARLARAKAASYARDMRALQEPRYKTGVNGELVPDVRAEAAIIYNPVTQEVLFESNSQNSRSIASITKVMTAVVFLEHATNLAEDVTIDPSDVRAASTTYLKSREHVTPSDLLNLLLIGSDNAAARALARISPFGSEGFIEQMNLKAAELGLQNTRYADSSGLNPANVSSAYDMARLISFAAGDERIASIMRKQNYSVTAGRRVINIHSTNQLVMRGDVDVQAGKTGFISKAGYCLATLLKLPQGPQIAVVVLGAKSNAGRFWETRHLFNWFSTKAQDLLGVAPVEAAELKPVAN